MTLPYAVALANKGWKQAVKDDVELLKGVNIVEGTIVYEDVAEAFGFECSSIQPFIS